MVRAVHKIINKKGFSLLEVIIVTGIFSVFFVTALSITTVFLRDLKLNESKIKAAHYAQEALEWVRGEKEEDWTSFSLTKAAPGLGSSWCFNDYPIENWPANTVCDADDFSLDDFYKRNVRLTTDNVNPQIIHAEVVVEWNMSGEVNQTKLNSSFSPPE